MAGRLTPQMRRRLRSDDATIAPVLPAETNASTSFDLTSEMPRLIEESGLLRTACTGCSPISMTSLACTMRSFGTSPSTP